MLSQQVASRLNKRIHQNGYEHDRSQANNVSIPHSLHIIVLLRNRGRGTGWLLGRAAGLPGLRGCGESVLSCLDVRSTRGPFLVRGFGSPWHPRPLRREDSPPSTYPDWNRGSIFWGSRESVQGSGGLWWADGSAAGATNPRSGPWFGMSAIPSTARWIWAPASGGPASGRRFSQIPGLRSVGVGSSLVAESEAWYWQKAR